MDRTWGGGGNMKTCLVLYINRDGMTSIWLGRSYDLHETLIGGQLHCANISPAIPRPSPNYSIYKQKKDIKILFWENIWYRFRDQTYLSMHFSCAMLKRSQKQEESPHGTRPIGKPAIVETLTMLFVCYLVPQIGRNLFKLWDPH